MTISKTKITTLLVFIIATTPLIAFFVDKYLGFGIKSFIGIIIYPTLILYFLETKKVAIPIYARYLFLYLVYVLFQGTILGIYSITPKLLYSNGILSFVAYAIVFLNYKPVFLNLEKIIIIFKTTIILSFIIIIYQDLVNPLFFVKLTETFEDLVVADYSSRRLPSIYSWLGIMELGITFIPILALTVDYEISKGSKNYWIWLVIGILVSFLSRARWVMLNMVFVLLVILVKQRKVHLKRLLRYITVIVFVLVTAYLLANILNINVNEIIYNRILQQQYGGVLEGSGGSRILAFEIFFKEFPKNPIFGRGAIIDQELEEILAGRSSQIHVGYLSLFYYYGIIGGGLYILFLYHILKDLYKSAKLTNMWGPLFGFMSFVLANLSLNYMRPWAMGILMCLVFKQYYDFQTMSKWHMLYYNRKSNINPRVIYN